MRWLSLLLPLCLGGLWVIYRAARANRSVYVSSGWRAEQRRHAMTRGWERETVSHTGKWNR